MAVHEMVSNEVEKVKEVPDEMGMLNNTICNLESSIHVLRESLSSVLTPSLVNSIPEGIRRELTPLASAISEYRDRCESINEQIKDILSRLQL